MRRGLVVGHSARARSPLDSCLRRNDARGRSVTTGHGDALRLTPALDSRFRGNDDGGGRADMCCWWRRGVPLWRDGRFAETPPTTGCVGVGDATGVGGGARRPRPVPLWIPAFAGMTRWGVCRNDAWGRAECAGNTRGGRRYDAWGRVGRTGDGDGPAPRTWPWVPAFAGTTVGVGGKDDAWGRPPSSVLRTGFDRLRANGRASSLWVAPCADGLSALGLY